MKGDGVKGGLITSHKENKYKITNTRKCKSHTTKNYY